MMTNLGYLVDTEIASGPARIDHIEKERSVKLLVQVRKSYPMQKVVQRVEKEYLVSVRRNLSEE